MRIRMLAAGLLSVVSMMIVGVPVAAAAAPAAHAASTRVSVPADIPAGYVAMTALDATSSTSVPTGGFVAVEYGFINAPSRPSDPQLYYRSPRGAVLEVDLDLYLTGGITIPSSWRPGTYRLIKVVTSVANLGGTQYRDHRYIGTAYNEDGTTTTVHATSPLSLAPMDLHVFAPHHCR